MAAAETATDAVSSSESLQDFTGHPGHQILEADYSRRFLRSIRILTTRCNKQRETEFIGKDGSKMDAEMKSADENIRPAEVHSVKNTGKTEVKGVAIEVNRPTGTTFSIKWMHPK